MGKLTVIEFLTLDGVMQGLGGPDEDTSGGFTHGGWSMPYADDAIANAAGEGMPHTDAYLFGRKTYECLAAHWPNQPDTDPIAAGLNHASKYVASRTHRQYGWRNTQPLAGEVPTAVAELKRRHAGYISVLGSGELVQTLIEHDLVDDFRLFVHPLVLGTGKRLFRDYQKVRKLRLIDAKPTNTGVLMLNYRTESEPEQ